MTTQEAIALYRSEKERALRKGVDLTTPQPIPERHHSRAPLLWDGNNFARRDAFIVKRPSPG